MRIPAMISTVAVVAALGLGACSSGGGAPGLRTGANIERPEGPAATISGPLSGGRGTVLSGAERDPDLTKAGFVEEEYTAAGVATSYRAPGVLPVDGTFELDTADSAAFETRIVVRRPAEANDFNGTVVVEWLNVSAGFDAAPDYTYLADELIRGGYAWVGVSAQHIGIEGGAVAVPTPVSALAGAGRGVRGIDAKRYAGLHHPGDAYSYDIYTQVGRALRSPDDVDPLGGLEAERLLAVGASQSAFALTTYVNGVQPLTRQFDGFLVHSRGSAAAPLSQPDASIDIDETVSGAPTRVRRDVDVPVMVVETETDVLGILNYYPARQPDTDRFRLWEIAGTAHIDSFDLGDVESLMGCLKPVNRGPQHVIMKAALRHLDTWAQGGDGPPEARRLETELSGGRPTFVRGADGNVQGGIRTPQVDVAVDVLSGEPAEGGSEVCLLMGTTTRIAAESLAERYRSRDVYLADYRAAADVAVAAGFALREDRHALLDDANPDRIAG